MKKKLLIKNLGGAKHFKIIFGGDIAPLLPTPMTYILKLDFFLIYWAFYSILQLYTILQMKLYPKFITVD